VSWVIPRFITAWPNSCTKMDWHG